MERQAAETPARNVPRKPEPHPGIAASAIALMSLAMAAGLDYVGVGAAIDARAGAWAASFGLEGEPRLLEAQWTWGWTVLATFGLCQALLHVVGAWRRWLLAVLATVVTVGWVPVLALAGIEPPIGVPLVALLWAVVASMFYAARHREPR